MTSPEIKKVKCPRCGKPALFAKENPARPFCSERCKLIDLGEWASESYRVPSQESGSVQDAEHFSEDSEENN